MKYKILTLFLLLSVCQLNAQSHNRTVQLSSNFDQSQGRLTFSANNRDFCDCHIQITFFNVEGFAGVPGRTSTTVGHGRHEILNFRVREGATRIAYNYQYAIFRGNINKRPNIDFAYALPAAQQEIVMTRIRENIEGFQLEFELQTDTIFAARGGVVCNDELSDHTAKGYRAFNSSRHMSQITIYHSDGTFAEYVFRGESLVRPGQHVRMGEAIAVFQQDMDVNALLFSVYFLDRNMIRDTNAANKHTHFRPFFQTLDEGRVRLIDGGMYISVLTNEMLMQDMNRRERRLFLQNR